MSATARVLDFARAAHRLPDEARADLERLAADTLAVGVAGSTAPGADGVFAAASRMGEARDTPVLGRDTRLSAPAAAMANGFQIHCLEWDAVHEPAVVHAMSVVTAAVHAACHRAGGVEPEEALAALAVGVEVACVLGVAATTGLRFFRPATAGVMGAALAVARIDGLPGEAFADVLGLAYSQAAGTMQAHVEGSIALPVQVGLAARAAITASDLAMYGLTAPHDVLEGPFGYFSLFDEGDLSAHVGSLGHDWRVREISVKPYPSGRASHAVLGTLERVREHGMPDAMVARVPPLIARLVGRPWADGMTPAYARLCLPFLAALMLTDGRIDPRRFTPASFGDAGLRALGARLRLEVDGNPNPNALFPQALDVTRGGRTETIAVPATSGSPANPLSDAQQADKIAFALSLSARPPRRFDPVSMLAGHA